MDAVKKELISAEIKKITVTLTDKDLEKLLWFARGLQKNNSRHKKQKLTHN